MRQLEVSACRSRSGLTLRRAHACFSKATATKFEDIGADTELIPARYSSHRGFMDGQRDTSIGVNLSAGETNLWM